MSCRFPVGSITWHLCHHLNPLSFWHLMLDALAHLFPAWIWNTCWPKATPGLPWLPTPSLKHGCFLTGWPPPGRTVGEELLLVLPDYCWAGRLLLLRRLYELREFYFKCLFKKYGDMGIKLRDKVKGNECFVSPGTVLEVVPPEQLSLVVWRWQRKGSMRTVIEAEGPAEAWWAASLDKGPMSGPG